VVLFEIERDISPNQKPVAVVVEVVVAVVAVSVAKAVAVTVVATTCYNDRVRRPIWLKR
jgi:hypothetical protein